MPEIHAERRLVKSPPELWAELSDLESLGRRLEEFGEIRITRLEPETAVAWEGDELRGTVELEASGWGTKVRLTVQAPEAEAVVETPETEGGIAPPEVDRGLRAQCAAPSTSLPEVDLDVVAPVPVAHPIAAEPIAAPPVGSVPPPSANVAPPSVGAEPRRRFLTRLFRRRRLFEPVDAAPPPPIAADPPPPPPQAPAPPEEPAIEEEPAAETPVVAQEPAAEAPEAANEGPGRDHVHVETVLAAVLDDLGAAHHRPFSRG